MNRGCVAALDATPRAHVLVHCLGRLGHAIIVAASLLIEIGMEPSPQKRSNTYEWYDQERSRLAIKRDMSDCTAQK
jgi:hypothetical protein